MNMMMMKVMVMDVSDDDESDDDLDDHMFLCNAKARIIIIDLHLTR